MNRAQKSFGQCEVVELARGHGHHCSAGHSRNFEPVDYNYEM